jgi:hypothetical protein
MNKENERPMKKIVMIEKIDTRMVSSIKENEQPMNKKIVMIKKIDTSLNGIFD